MSPEASQEPSDSLTVKVGDQVFRIRVLPEERERFQRVEQFANRALGEVLGSGVVGGVRAYAMACFQLAMEVEEGHDALRRAEESRNRLGQLIRRIDSVTEEEERNSE